MFNALIAVLALASAEEPAATSPQSGQNNERICRGGGERTLGSHIRTRRRCQTAEEWRREEEEARSRPAPGLLVTEGQNDGRATAAPH